MSPMMPSADGNMPSGSSGWGTSGNPDVPGGGDTSELNNPSNMYGSWRDRFRDITGPMDAYGGGPGWSWHRPEWDYAGPMATGGTGQGKQPPQAPPASNDRSTEADRRLADLNSGTGGVNPNGQTGSSMYDDMRNMRAPIGNITLAQDPTGGPQIGSGTVTGGMISAGMYVEWFGSYEDRVLFRQILRKIMDPSAPDPTGVTYGYINVNAMGQYAKYKVLTSPIPKGTMGENYQPWNLPRGTKKTFWQDPLGWLTNEIKWKWSEINNAGTQSFGDAWTGATSMVSALVKPYVEGAKIAYSVGKDIWENPVFQFGMDVLAAITIFTPIPFDDVIWMSRAGRTGRFIKIYLGIDAAGDAVYVGQTVQKISVRLSQHQRTFRKFEYLRRALRFPVDEIINGMRASRWGDLLEQQILHQNRQQLWYKYDKLKNPWGNRKDPFKPYLDDPDYWDDLIAKWKNTRKK